MIREIAKFGILPVMSLTMMTACGQEPDAPTGEVTVLTGARLIDGNGGPPIENAVLVIRGERLEEVGSATEVTVPAGAEVVDLSGKTIMPGIIALHAHLARTTTGLNTHAENFNEENLRDRLNLYAEYGVLHTVSLGSDKPLVYEVRDRQRQGEFFPGARLYTAGRGFGIPQGYPSVQPGVTEDTDVNRLSSPEQVPERVEELARNDVEFVKMWVDDSFGTQPPFSPAIYQAIIQEAHSHGMRAFAHIFTYENADLLVDAGADGLLHMVRDRPVDAALIDKMKARDVFAIPTLTREEAEFIYAERAPYLDDPFLTDNLPASTIETLASPEFQAEQAADPYLEDWGPILLTAQRNLKTMHDAGVKIGFGSDSGQPRRFEGYFEHREMELMVEAGLTPLEVIQIASKNSAEILGIDADYGTIEPGKMAEFLVLSANPLDNISNTKTLEQVWQRGQKIVDRNP